MEVPLVKKKPQPSQVSAQKKPYRRVHPANQDVIEPNPQRQIMNPQVSFCEKIEELNESESHNTMQATQGNERDKPRFTFNIGQNLQEQMRTQLQQMPAAKDKHVADKRDFRADSLGSDSSN